MENSRSYSLILHSSSKNSLHIPLLITSIIIAGLLLPSPANASTIIYSGTTEGGPTWNRPVANDTDPPVELSPDGDAVPYSAYEFQVDTSGLYELSSTALEPFGWDNYTFLYVTSFDPTNPLQNVVIGIDDNSSGSFDSTLVTSTNYFFVTTGFSDFDSGTFQNSIELLQASNPPVPPPATAPEPNTFLLFGVFGAGIVIASAGRKRLL
jgi:hypothetical protein